MEEIKGMLNEILAELKKLNANIEQSRQNAQEAMQRNKSQVDNTLSALNGMIPPHLRSVVDNIAKGGT
ncbi:MAG: hypothetical protein HPY65_13865 [Syntrophaceae bacterium]|nr:hypothetical protein [Syntrophaceae bacterium]